MFGQTQVQHEVPHVKRDMSIDTYLRDRMISEHEDQILDGTLADFNI